MQHAASSSSSYVFRRSLSRCRICSIARYATSSRSTDDAGSGLPTPDAVRQHTLSMVQKYDYPNYLATSFYPTHEARYDYLAIRTFNVELSNVADSVRNAQLGKIRFQWWRDAVQSLNTSTPIPHPTVLALSVAAKRRKLSNYHLNRLIDARERNLLSPAYNSLSELVSYAQSTALPLLLLQMQLVLQPGQNKVDDIPLSTIDHSLSHLATYISIAQLLRSIPYFAGSHRTITIPRDVASAHGIVDEQVFRALPALNKTPIPGSPSANALAEAFPAVQTASHELANLADGERAKARATLGLEEATDEEHAALAQGRRLSRLPKQLIPVFLSAIPAKSMLQQLQGVDYNVFSPAFNQPQQRNWKLPAQMWWAQFRGQM